MRLVTVSMRLRSAQLSLRQLSLLGAQLPQSLASSHLCKERFTFENVTGLTLRPLNPLFCEYIGLRLTPRRTSL